MNRGKKRIKSFSPYGSPQVHQEIPEERESADDDLEVGSFTIDTRVTAKSQDFFSTSQNSSVISPNCFAPGCCVNQPVMFFVHLFGFHFPPERTKSAGGTSPTADRTFKVGS